MTSLFAPFQDPRFWQPKVKFTLLTLAVFAALC
jgi:hypothetical protein